MRTVSRRRHRRISRCRLTMIWSDGMEMCQITRPIIGDADQCDVRPERIGIGSLRFSPRMIER